MSAYEPPIENVPEFDVLLFRQDDTPLTIGTASKLFLRYPNAQGEENLAKTNVSGLLTANGGITSTGDINANADLYTSAASTFFSQGDFLAQNGASNFLVNPTLKANGGITTPTINATIATTGDIIYSASQSTGNTSICPSQTSGTLSIAGSASRTGVVNIANTVGSTASVNIGTVAGGLTLGDWQIIAGTSAFQRTGNSFVRATGNITLDTTSTGAQVAVGQTPTTGTINIAGAQTTGILNIGTGTRSGGGSGGAINIGTGSSSAGAYINIGTGVRTLSDLINIGNNASSAASINIGNSTNSNFIGSVAITGATMSFAAPAVIQNSTVTQLATLFDTNTSGNIRIGTSQTSGGLFIGTGARTGNINIGSGVNTGGSINIGTGTGSVTVVDIASATGDLTVNCPIKPTYSGTAATLNTQIGYQSATATSTVVPSTVIGNIANSGALPAGVWAVEGFFSAVWTGTPADSLIVWSLSTTSATNDGSREFTQLMNKNLITSAYNGRLNTIFRLSASTTIYLVAQVNGTNPTSCNSNIRFTRIA